MNYQVGQKVTIQEEDWYNTNKQANGFIIFKDGNKISTFSPGMVKFCGQTFTVAKVVTGSSIYPDHYTFVEDGGAYKWSDQMIAGPADGSTTTYVKPEQPAVPAPVQTKPTETTKTKVEPKPKKEPKHKSDPKPADTKKENPNEEEEHQWNDLGSQATDQPEPEPQKPVEQPKPQSVPESQPKPVEQPKPQPAPTPAPAPAPAPKPVNPEPQEEPSGEITAFESFKLLLKPKDKAPLADCAVQAFQIISANDMFPEVSFDFNGFEFSITRK